MANNLPQETRNRIGELASQGWSARRIADEMHVTKETAQRWAKRETAAKATLELGPQGLRLFPGVDVHAVVEEVLARVAGNQEARAEAVEVVQKAPALFPMTKSKVVDLSGKKFERIAFISDLHHPFQDDAAIKVALAAIKDYRPQLVLIAGDYFDCFSISDHDKDPGRCDTIQDEFDAARPTSQMISEAAGDATKIFVKGNHEERIDRMQRKNPGLFRLRSLELPIAAELPKDWLYYPDQTRFKIGSITGLHGNLKGRGNGIKHAAFGMLSKLRTSCIFGHLHRFQNFYETTEDGSYRAGFANGHLCDVLQAEYITVPDWQEGISTIDYDWSLNVFAVTPHLIVRNALRWGSKTYASAA